MDISRHIAEVQERIRAAVPEANLTGHPMESLGGATWAPTRSPSKDFSAWGPWEAWEHCRIGAVDSGLVGPITTGAWVAWNSATGEQILPGRSDMPVRHQAEAMATMNNEGKATRVVFKDGRFEVSALVYERLKRELLPGAR